MSNWADQAQEEDFYDEVASKDSYNSDYEDLKTTWANAKTETSREVDADGNAYVVTRKVRQYHVDRPITTADLRARLGHFGKGLGDQATLVSTEPPLALEMGSVDQWVRETRAEVKRIIHEVSNVEVVVKDEHLRVVRDLEEKDRKSGSRTAAAGSTWASVASRPTDTREQMSNGIRIRNVSDDITQENLLNIFEGFGWSTKSLRIPRGDNNQSRGFAFVVFDEAWMADAAIQKQKLFFKNVVLDVSRAETRM